MSLFVWWFHFIVLIYSICHFQNKDKVLFCYVSYVFAYLNEEILKSNFSQKTHTYTPEIRTMIRVTGPDWCFTDLLQQSLTFTSQTNQLNHLIVAVNRPLKLIKDNICFAYKIFTEHFHVQFCGFPHFRISWRQREGGRKQEQRGGTYIRKDTNSDKRKEGNGKGRKEESMLMWMLILLHVDQWCN